jgi:hypothetical protein
MMLEDFLVAVSLKSRPKFYFEKERPSFHTAWVMDGPADENVEFAVLHPQRPPARQVRKRDRETPHIREVAGHGPANIDASGAIPTPRAMETRMAATATIAAPTRNLRSDALRRDDPFVMGAALVLQMHRLLCTS